MMRPTSVWRSCTRKIVVFPDGISESIISSGNSTSWRMTNSRNSFTNPKLPEAFALVPAVDRAPRLILHVGCQEIFGVLADWTDFLAIGTEEPKPIVGTAT